MASTRKKCLNWPDSFCSICGSFTVPSQRTSISEFVKEHTWLILSSKYVININHGHNLCKP